MEAAERRRGGQEGPPQLLQGYVHQKNGGAGTPRGHEKVAFTVGFKDALPPAAAPALYHNILFVHLFIFGVLACGQYGDNAPDGRSIELSYPGGDAVEFVPEE